MNRVCDTSHYPKDGPWALPEGWAFSHIGDVVRLINGRAYKKEELLHSGKYKVLRVGNFFTNDSWYYSDLELDAEKYCDNGDLLYAWSASFGARIWNEGKTIFHYHIWKVQYDERLLDKMFLYYYLEWDKQTILNSTTGSTMIHVSMENMRPRVIVIPPISEQRRIVKAIERWNSIISALESDSRSINNSVSAAKNRVLDLAIHGKLVPQDPSDEPAIELLKRLKPAFTPSHNLHYEGDLPKGWCFSTLGELFQHNTGKALNAVDSKGEMLRYITTSNLYWDRFDLSEIRTMPFTVAEKEKCRAVKGDLLVCEGGDIGRAAIWPYDESIMIQNHIHRLRPKAQVSVRFYYYVLNLYKRKGLIGGKGIGIQGLSSRELDKMVIPVPPIKEQHRIVLAIEEKFAVLNEIEAAC